MSSFATYINCCFLGMSNMREICYTLAYTYPAMFQHTGGYILNNDEGLAKSVFHSEVAGAGGKMCPEKIEILAPKMKERLRGQLRVDMKNNNVEVEEEVETGESARKKGKSKIIYGET